MTEDHMIGASAVSVATIAAGVATNLGALNPTLATVSMVVGIFTCLCLAGVRILRIIILLRQLSALDKQEKADVDTDDE